MYIKAQVATVLFLAAMLAFASLGCGVDVHDDGGSAPTIDEKAADLSPPPPSAMEDAAVVDTAPGVAWTASTDYDAPTFETLGFSYMGKSWIVKSAPYSWYVSISLTSTESMAIHAIPYDSAGDVDVILWKNGTQIKSSYRPAGYIDPVFTPPDTPGWDGQYLIEFRCVWGTCNFGSTVIKGDNDNYLTHGVYLNQRSFTQNNNKCTLNGTSWVADGECMCADASAAMGLVVDGKRPINQLASSASDLFANCQTSQGAAVASLLMDRLKSTYGYGNCEQIWNSSTLKDTIRSKLRFKHMVLFRSTSLTSAGHYVQVRGYSTDTNGKFWLRVNDPMGAWTSLNTWSPKNSTSTSYGDDTLLDFEKVRPNGSIIACK